MVRGRAVLRITAVGGTGPVQTLRIEGRIDGVQAEELSRTATPALAASSRLILDMSGVTFIDRAGVAVVRRLCAGGAELSGCSSFIGTLLNGGVG
jgi:anti-anti-sigma factor